MAQVAQARRSRSANGLGSARLARREPAATLAVVASRRKGGARMSLPRERHRSTTYLVTRRCDGRELGLVPGAELNAAFAVALCDAAERHGCEVVALTVLSNHYHMVVHDRWGTLSELLRDLHATVARYCNVTRGRRHTAFWDRQQTDAVELHDADVIVDAVAYCLANAVRAGLVETPEEWPGLRTRVEDLGLWRGPVFARPSAFFREAGPVSEMVELCTEVPPLALAAYGAEGFRERVRVRLAATVAAKQAEMKRQGRSFMGRAAVLRQSPSSSPKTPDQRQVGRRATARRTVAARSRWHVQALVARVKAFRACHAEALAAFARGIRAALFPAGTWLAWRRYGVRRSTRSDGPQSVAAG
ncbi:MAG: hypothetical protein U1F43_10435 [Myxococcota bacterium]